MDAPAVPLLGLKGALDGRKPRRWGWVGRVSNGLSRTGESYRNGGFDGLATVRKAPPCGHCDGRWHLLSLAAGSGPGAAVALVIALTSSSIRPSTIPHRAGSESRAQNASWHVGRTGRGCVIHTTFNREFRSLQAPPRACGLEGPRRCGCSGYRRLQKVGGELSKGLSTSPPHGASVFRLPCGKPFLFSTGPRPVPSLGRAGT